MSSLSLTLRDHAGRRFPTGGFTLLEMVLATGLLLLLVLLVIPVMDHLASKARGAVCVGNLRQIFSASLAYQAEHRNQWPANRPSPDSISFSTVLEKYLGPYPVGLRATDEFRMQRSVLICPADRFGVVSEGSFVNVYSVGSPRHGLSYAQNSYVNSDSSAYGTGLRPSVPQSARLAVYMDWESHYVASYQTLNTGEGVRRRALMKRHGGSINIAFADGHLEAMRIDEIPDAAPPPVPFWAGRDKGSKP